MGVSPAPAGSGRRRRRWSTRVAAPAVVSLLVIAPIAASAVAVAPPAGAEGRAPITYHGVVLTHDRLPVPGATVAGWGPVQSVSTTSGPDGRFTLTLRAGDPTDVSVYGGPPPPALAGSLPNSTGWGYPIPRGLDGDPAVDRELVLPAPTGYPVEVLGPDGTPVAGARVSAESSQRWPFPVAGPDDGMGAHRTSWRLQADGAGLATLRSWTDLGTGYVSSDLDDDCTLSTTVPLTEDAIATVRLPAVDAAVVESPASLRAATGEPAAGATVLNTFDWPVPVTDAGTSTDPPVHGDCRYVATTDAAGAFTRRMSAHSTSVEVRVTPSAGTAPAPWAPDSVTWSATPDPTVEPDGSTTYRMPPVSRIGVVVVGADGRPVPGARVRVSATICCGEKETWPLLVTDDSGRFAVRTWARGRDLDDAPELGIRVRSGTGGAVRRASLNGLVPAGDVAITMTLGRPGARAVRWGFPPAPRDVTVTRVGDRLRLTWKAPRPNGFPVAGYAVMRSGPYPDVWLPADARHTTVPIGFEDGWLMSAAADPFFYGDGIFSERHSGTWYRLAGPRLPRPR